MNRAMLIHAGAIGDFVMSLRIIESLRSTGFERITILGRSSIARLALDAGLADQVIDIDTGGCHAIFSESAPLPAALHRELEGLDLVVDMLGGPDSPLAGRLSSVGVGRVIHIDPRPREHHSRHVTDQWLDVLDRAGLQAHVAAPSIQVDGTARSAARAVLEQRVRANPSRLTRPASLPDDPPLVLIHPGSGGREKCWPLENFIHLAARLQASGRCVVYLGGPVEEERFAAELVLLEQTAPLLTKLPIHELPTRLAGADAFIGNDSGITHLAAAVGIPVVAIFGPTDPAIWSPLGAHVTVLKARSHGWPTVDDVFRECLRIT